MTRPRVEHRPRVAESRDPGAVQNVGIDTRHLRRDIGAESSLTAARLIDKLDRRAIEPVAGTGEKRIQELEHGRTDSFKSVRPHHFEGARTQGFKFPRLPGQHVGNMIR